jgi:glycosyltransferase involved in cell wall biosynthesis
MRVSVLWGGLAPYSVALFRELALSQNCTVQLIYQPAKSHAPYQDFDLSFCEKAQADIPDRRSSMRSLVAEFAPDLVLMTSWNYPHYMRVAKAEKRRGAFVLSAMDNQWLGTPRQWLGVATSRWHLAPAISAFFVAGDRQANFARKLGFHDVLYGVYAADVPRFASQPPIRDRPRNFLFVGRLVKEKGIRNLVTAYQMYRDRCENPWGLVVAGTGPFARRLENVDGIIAVGFVEPERLPSLFGEASCFVLPSLFEPWGVVIHEAAASGLPIICSDRCGASTMFVRDGLNGSVIPAHGPRLTAAFAQISNSSLQELEMMSAYSYQLAGLWTPQLAAEYVVKSITLRIANHNEF